MKRLALVVVERAWVPGLGVVLLLAGSLASSLAASSFIGVGFLPDGFSSDVKAVSGDGSTVVGHCSCGRGPNYRAFRWTAAGGMVGLGNLPGCSNSWASAASSDGSVVVGGSSTSLGSGQQAFLWTATGGMTRLGALSGAGESIARAVSADGTVVAGESGGKLHTNSRAFRWTATGGMVSLGVLPGDTQSSAYAISADGKVIVGISESTSGCQAFRWTSSGGMVGLGMLHGCRNSMARSISRDGSVVVGMCQHKSDGKSIQFVGSSIHILRLDGSESFRWTIEGGMMGLGSLPGDLCCKDAWAVSGDGSTVMGRVMSEELTKSQAKVFVWDKANGMRDLQSVLTADYHLDLTGWTLFYAFGISTDGKTIGGLGKHDGHEEGWVAHLDRPLNETGKAKGK